MLQSLLYRTSGPVLVGRVANETGVLVINHEKLWILCAIRTLR